VEETPAEAPEEAPEEVEAVRPEKAERKSVLRQRNKVEASVAKKEDKEHLENKYDVNLKDSDDSSDEEVLIRTGDVPAHWYDLYDHKGYNVKGKQVTKMVEKDELEKFIERQGDKDWWKKITDDLNNKEVKLSEADLDMLVRMRAGKFVDKNIDPYNEEWNFERNDHPNLFITGFNGNNYLPKRGFIPSKWERLRVSKYI